MDKMRRTLTGSATSALAALLMLGAITFGATVIRPMTADRNADATTAETDDGSTAGNLEQPIVADKPAGDTHDAEKASEVDEEYPDWRPSNVEESKDEPADVPKDEPKAEPKDEPAPAPSGDLAVSAFLNDTGKITVEWSAFTGDFEKYKLVRSTDATTTWPLSDGDELVAVTGPGETRFVDKYAPCNTELHYRAFAVRHGESGYVVLASSNVGAALRECSEAPPAEPSAMGFELMRTEEGVKLSWEASASGAFVVYKVVRSASNANPIYPLNDGTELIGVIGDAGNTFFVDTGVSAGQTWTYRVLSMGEGSGGWVVLGLTAALTITVE